MIFMGSNRTESEEYNGVKIMTIALVESTEMIVQVKGILVRCQERDNSPLSMPRA